MKDFTGNSNSEKERGHLPVYRPGTSDGISDFDFYLFSELIARECGFTLGAEKRAFLESRLKRRMAELGIAPAHEYYCMLNDRVGGERELAALLDRMMICETSFFRNPSQFDLLKDVVLPGLLADKEQAGSRLIRVWSAGCSTGQEPYSLVICINEALPARSDWTVRVLASDLSYTALEKARSGVYRRDQMKGVGAESLEKYFREEDGAYRVMDFVRRDVIFDYHNLKHENGLKGLDVIFCRNVLIYFSVEDQRRMIDRLTGVLAPGGYLFLGHAESLQGLSSGFTMIHRNKGIAYRLNS